VDDATAARSPSVCAPRWPQFAAAALGFVWYLQIGGGPTLNPTHTRLILSGDWMQHWFGWLMFRREDWTLPLGTISGLLHPIGTTVGFTDSNPLLSILLKPFSSLLPAEFQFIGLWLASCFVLQGYMGAALASTVTDDPREQLFGGYLFVLSPVLLARLAHDTLAAHWLLLVAMYLGLREYGDARRARRATWLAACTAVLAASIHPYLAVMCWVLALAAFVRLWRARLIPPVQALLAAAAATAGMVSVFALAGYFSTGRMGASGFGQYSADLLSLVNPDQFSRALFDLRLTSASWEGLGFVGLGGLAAVAVAIGALPFVRPRLRRGAWVVVLACVLMGVFALSWDVRLGGRQVADLSGWYEPLSGVTAPLRASGRFIWGLHYLVLLFGIWGVTRMARASRQAAGAMLLAVLVVLQAADMRMDSLWARDQFREVRLENFASAVGRYRHLALFPMQVRGVCTPYNEAYVYRYMLHAYRLKTTYNSGYFARLDGAAVAAACDQLSADVAAGRLDAQTIYVVEESRVPKFKQANAVCGRFDGDWICVSRDSDEVFRTLVETGKLIERSK
jgi:hypothetical protein